MKTWKLCVLTSLLTLAGIWHGYQLGRIPLEQAYADCKDSLRQMQLEHQVEQP